jgi:hypothetical protein
MTVALVYLQIRIGLFDARHLIKLRRSGSRATHRSLNALIEATMNSQRALPPTIKRIINMPKERPLDASSNNADC